MNMEMTNFVVAGQTHEAHLQGGYIWRRNFFYDPAKLSPEPPSGLPAELFWNNIWQLNGRYWIWVQPRLAFGVISSIVTGGVPDTGNYDAMLTQGLSGSLGPFIEFNTLNDPRWPTNGMRARTWATQGLHAGNSRFMFWQMQSEWLQTWNWVGHILLFRITAGAGFPRLAWINKYAAGGGNFLRGYQWNRFTGDRLAVASLEYRRNLGSWRANPLGLLGPEGLAFNLAGAAYLDGGRVWEPRLGPAMGEDIRIGGGASLILLVGGVPLGRLELNGSSEGIFPVIAAGTSF